MSSSGSKLVIIGAGRQGAETLEVARQISRITGELEILGFFDDSKPKGDSVLGVPILGGIDEAKELIEEHPDTKAIVAIGVTKTRKEVAEKYSNIGLEFTTLIHPTAVMSDSVKIGKGTMIAAGCILTVDIEIGDHVLINPLSSIAHDVRIGDYVTINALCGISGNDTIEDGVYVGVGAKITQGLRIGAWTVLGAGAVIVKDIPSGVIAVGMPAKPIKPNPSVDDEA